VLALLLPLLLLLTSSTAWASTFAMQTMKQ
jgi:hypothetical protein